MILIFSCFNLHTVKVDTITESAAFGSFVPADCFQLCNGITACFCNRIHEKSPDTEQRVEDVLLQHNIYYTKSEVWIESEKLYEVLYIMEV